MLNISSRDFDVHLLINIIATSTLLESNLLDCLADSNKNIQRALAHRYEMRLVSQ